MPRYTMTLQDAINAHIILATRECLALMKAQEERAHRETYKAELRARLLARKAAVASASASMA